MKQKKQAAPANKIKAADRKRFTREEVEAAIRNRRNYGTYYENR